MSVRPGSERGMSGRVRGDSGIVATLPVLLAALLTIIPGAGPGARMACGQDRAMGPWWERAWADSSEHYWIRTDLPRADAQAIARHLDTMYEEFSRRLAHLPPRAPTALNVYLFRSQRDYELTLRARFGVNAAGTGGLFFVTGPNHGLALWTGNLSERRIRHVIQHEGFHQFAWSRFGGDLPNWVNEGLAEFFGLAVLVGDDLIIGQSHARTLERVQDAIERNSYLPFNELIGMSNDYWMQQVNSGDASLLYDQAWSMVHFLVYGDGGRYTQPFEHYLRLINNGLPSEEAFYRAFETRETHAFEERWKLFMNETKPSAFVTALERIEFLAEGSLALARQGVYPESLDDLREELEGIDFEYAFLGHSRQVRLGAADEQVYRIPMDDRTVEQPVFTVARPNQRRMLLRERKLEEKHPTPSIISTEHLEPRELTVEWRRDEDDPSVFTYQIQVR